MTDLRYVVYIVGAALLLCVVGIIGIAGFTDRTIPDVLQNIAVGCLTGLVGLLVPSSVSRHRGEGGHMHPFLQGAIAVVVFLAAVWLFLELAGRV